ncbi:MAG: oligosaccharyl transferase, archaeosortase A system-associated, partial [Chloroflexi bacterium]|nr:oligosaccharyl transferase, archaeosortase A system-associated [Chloroflexota bacterium]
MSEKRFPSWTVAGVLVGLFFLVALCLRVIPPYGKVFVGDWIKFTGNDTYYFMRVVDNLVHNFPHLNSFDPYLLYPEGAATGVGFLFNYMLASVAWVLGLGSPSQHLVDVVGVYFPAVLGALVVVPVYFIGRGLFGRWAGVIAAGLVGIYPGEFLGRSVLGFTDYHVAEVLFTCVAAAFLVYAVKSGRQTGDMAGGVGHFGWGGIAKPLLYSVFGGIFLGMYLLTWHGALLFVLIFFIFLVLQIIIDHLRNRSAIHLGFIGLVVFGIALMMYLPVRPEKMYVASLVIGIVVPVALAGLSYLMAKRRMKLMLYPVVVVVAGVVGFIALRLVAPELFGSMMSSLGIFRWPIGTTLYEMQPILYPGGQFSWLIVWLNFTTGFLLSIAGLGILIYQVIKGGEGEKTLLVVWSLVILLVMLAQRRFAYYYVVNVALLTGYVSWLVLELAGFRERAAVTVEVVEKSRKKHRRERKKQDTRGLMVLTAIAVFFLVFYPNIGPLPRVGQVSPGTKLAIDLAGQTPFAPSNGWCQALDWMRENTPEPFGNPNYYYERYSSPQPGERYVYPETAYGVAAWWDYGYWITRMGRRIPISNPGTGHRGEAFLFIAQDEAAASKAMDSAGAEYVVVDFSLAMPTGKFHALPKLSGGKTDEYYDVYYEQKAGKLEPLIVLFPEYYRSLVVRLFNFDGERVIPESATVVSYREMTAPDGVSYKLVESIKTFASYEEALANVQARKGEDVRI